MTALLAAAMLGCLLGSIPFGLVLTRLAGLGDIRRVGSGNIGATNVLRTGRKDIAAATVVLDGAKGAAAVMLAAAVWGGWTPLLAGTAAVLGHCVNPWLGGRGGKGVATGLGVYLAWAWPLGLLCCAVWLAGAWATRRSSAAGLLAFGLAPALMLLFRPWDAAVAALCVMAVIVVRHGANIRRLLAGTEPRIGAS